MLASVVTITVTGFTDGGEDNGSTLSEITDCPSVDKSDGPRISFSNRPIWCLTSGVSYTAVFETSEGDIHVALDTKNTPETTNNFVVLARYGYYDNTLLFRMDPTIGIIQGGAPTTNSTFDPGPGYNIPDEGGTYLPNNDGSVTGPFSYVPGQLVMARSRGPNSSGAQFFFTTNESVSLLDSSLEIPGSGSYIVFGNTDDLGLKLLQKMMDLYESDPESPYGGGPIRDLELLSVAITEN